MRRSLDGCRREKNGLRKERREIEKCRVRRKWHRGAQTQKTLHNAFHVHVVIRLRKSTQKKAIKITNERERREKRDSHAEEIL